MKDAATIARKTVRDWFTKHPVNFVSFHWRWNELSQWSKENMSTPRTATVHPRRIAFRPHQSEMSLSNISCCNVTVDDKLQIYFDGQGGVAVEYTAAEGR